MICVHSYCTGRVDFGECAWDFLPSESRAGHVKGFAHVLLSARPGSARIQAVGVGAIRSVRAEVLVCVRV